MKRIRILALVLLCALLLPLCPAALAADDMDALYKGKSWDEVVDAFLDAYGTDRGSITLGYYNTVTGEEHYLNPDQYMVAASMYKVPLNMIYVEKIVKGEMDWDTTVAGYRYEVALEESIVHSNNDISVSMSYSLGNNNWRAFRRILAPYMGEDPETVDPKFFENNFSTARQMISCLKMLYGENERFPRIIETMQRAEPHNYFKLREQRFNIAHKYGFLTTEYHLYMNDCGIAYTDDPILLVCYTDNVGKAYDVLTDYCTLMCDYAQYHTAERHAQEAEEEARRKAEEEERRRAEEEAAREEAQNAQESPVISRVKPTARPAERTETKTAAWTPIEPPYALGIVLAALALAAAIELLALAARTRRRAWGPLLLLLSALLAAELLIFLPFLRAPEGDPQETVRRLLDALEDGRYETAYTLLEGDSRLGLERTQETELAAALAEALRSHASYSIYGECRVERDCAWQLVNIQTLDLAAMQPELESQTVTELTKLASGRKLEELYDENGQYRLELREEASLLALEKLLQHPQDYLRTTGIQLELHYRDGAWTVVASDALLRLLIGGLETEGGAA